MQNYFVLDMSATRLCLDPTYAYVMKENTMLPFFSSEEDAMRWIDERTGPGRYIVFEAKLEVEFKYGPMMREVKKPK